MSDLSNKIKLKQIFNKETGLSWEYDWMNYIDWLEDIFILQQANEANKQPDTKALGLFGVSGCTPVHFGRFLLKDCIPIFKENALCWSYGNEFYDTKELYEKFCSV